VNKHLYLCHLLVLSSPTLMMHGHRNLKLLIISRSFLLRMGNISNNSCGENQNRHFVLSNFFFENRAVYEKTWKNIVEWDRPQKKMWRMRVACWIPKTTKKHSVCVILITFLQQWLHERASMLLSTYIDWLVIFGTRFI